MATAQSVETPANEISTQSRLPGTGAVESVYLEQTPDSTGLEQDAVAHLAYELWQGRGCPEGSPEADLAGSRTAFAAAQPFSPRQ